MAEWDAERVEQWVRSQAERDETFGPATEKMLDGANIKAGYRVLDVAVGAGGSTLLAARRVGPNGHVLAIDTSANMLNAAAEATQGAGLTNVETRVMDGENLDLDGDSFDAVICRFAMHQFSSPPTALREMHRVVRPEGKVAALVYSTVEKNPYRGVPMTVAHRLGGTMPRSQFVLGEQVLEDTFRDGGFPEVAVQTVSIQRRFSSSAEVIRRLKDDMPGRYIAALGDAEREQAWAEVEQQMRRFEGPNGCEVPGELLMGVGTK